MNVSWLIDLVEDFRLVQLTQEVEVIFSNKSPLFLVLKIPAPWE